MKVLAWLLIAVGVNLVVTWCFPALTAWQSIVLSALITMPLLPDFND